MDRLTWVLVVLLVVVIGIGGCSRLFGGGGGDPDVEKKPSIVDRLLGDASKPEKKTSSIMNWLIFLSIIGIGASVALAVSGNVKSGIIGAAASGAVLFTSIVLATHAVLIATIGVVIVILISVILLRELWLRRKAITEVITTAELAKLSLPKAARDRIFGAGDDTGKAGDLQSTATQRIVSKVRGKD